MTDETEKLNRSLGDMREKSRALNDSLQELAASGFDELAKAVSRAGAAARGGGARDPGDIARSEMARFLRQELAGVFGGRGGQAGMSVVIHNNAAAIVTAREGIDAFDRKTPEITIDQMVANSLLRGRETGGVLRSLFGLVPALIGR